MLIPPDFLCSVEVYSDTIIEKQLSKLISPCKTIKESLEAMGHEEPRICEVAEKKYSLYWDCLPSTYRLPGFLLPVYIA